VAEANEQQGVRATIKVISTVNDISQCEVGGHKFEFGGQGDGYCYAHQSFHCIHNHTEAEKKAIDEAEYEEET
jgi:hypothetical protein